MGKIAYVCREFGLINSKIQRTCKNITKIIRACERKGWRIKRFRKPERRDVNEAFLKWLKQQISDDVPVSGPIMMVLFVFPKF